MNTYRVWPNWSKYTGLLDQTILAASMKDAAERWALSTGLTPEAQDGDQCWVQLVEYDVFFHQPRLFKVKTILLASAEVITTEVYVDQ